MNGPGRTTESGVVTEPTPGEIARDLERLEERVTRERAELFKEMNRRFDVLEAALERHAVGRISRDRYEADQQRHEAALRTVERDMGRLFAETKRMKWLLVGSPAAVIVTAMALAQYVGGA